MKKYLCVVCAFFAVLSQDLAAESGATEQTLSIIKPDAVAANHIGEILTRFEHAGLRIVGMKMMQLSQDQAADFYAVHKERPFYADLVGYMTSGPITVLVLEGPDAVTANREIMGATDPGQAKPGTLRASFGTSIQENAVHGSDSLDNARQEIRFFFAEKEVHPRTR
jgi:nucleoside-diphosphate kinase